MDISITGNDMSVVLSHKERVKDGFIGILNKLDLDLGYTKSYHEILKYHFIANLYGLKVCEIDKESLIITVLKEMGDEKE